MPVGLPVGLPVGGSNHLHDTKAGVPCSSRQALVLLIDVHTMWTWALVGSEIHPPFAFSQVHRGVDQNFIFSHSIAVLALTLQNPRVLFHGSTSEGNPQNAL